MLFKVIYKKEIHILNKKEAISLIQLTQFIKNAFKQLPLKYILVYIDSQSDRISLINQNDMVILHQSGLNKVRVQIEEIPQILDEKNQEFDIGKQEGNIEPIIIEKQKEEVEKVFSTSFASNINLRQGQISNFLNLDQFVEQKMENMMPDLIDMIKQQIMQEKIKYPKFIQAEQDYNIHHPQAVCSQCGQNPIIGIRYKCVVCSNVDLCQKCELKTLHEHFLLKIRRPSQALYKVIVVPQPQREKQKVFIEKIEIKNINNNSDSSYEFACPNQQKQEAMKQMVENQDQLIKQEIKKDQQKNVQQLVNYRIQKSQDQTIIGRQQQIKKVEVLKNQITQEDIFIAKANYLCEIINKNFTKCLKYAQKHNKLSKQDLLQLYLLQVPF